MNKRIYFILITLFLTHCVANAQWVRTNCPLGPEAIVVHNNFLFSAGEGGIHRSSDNGETWELATKGLYGNSYPPEVTKLYSFGNYIIANVLDWGTFRSSDNGNSWVRAKLSRDFAFYTSSNGFLFALYSEILSRSVDSANTWVVADSGITPVSLSSGHSFCIGITSIESRIFVINSDGQLFNSSNNGQYWENSHNDSDSLLNNIRSLYAVGTNIFGREVQTIIRSSDFGKTWKIIKNDFGPSVFIADGSQIFVGGYGGVILSTNNGDTWRFVNDSLIEKKVIETLAIKDGYLFAGAYNQGLWRRPLSDFASVAEQPQTQPTPSLKISTTETGDHVIVTYHTERDIEHPKFEIYDILGRLISSSIEHRASKGLNSILYPTNNLTTGTYFCKVSGEGFSQANSIHITK